MGSDADNPAPHAVLVPATVTFPDVALALNETVMVLLPAPPVIVHPAGRVQE